MNNNSEHIEVIKLIDGYVKGQLSEEEKDKLWAYMLENPEYYDLMETEASLDAYLREKTKKEAPVRSIGSGPMSATWKWMAAAAAVAVLIVGLNLLSLQNDQSIREMAMNEISYGKIETPDIMRSDTGKPRKIDSLLNLGFEAVVSGEVQNALSIYNNIIDQYSDDPSVARAYLNVGIIQYNKGTYEQAARSFKKAVEIVEDNKLLEEKAYWYMGNAYINIERLPEARDAIHEAFSIDGIYRKPAFRLLRKLDYDLGNVDYDNFEEQIKNS